MEKKEITRQFYGGWTPGKQIVQTSRKHPDRKDTAKRTHVESKVELTLPRQMENQNLLLVVAQTTPKKNGIPTTKIFSRQKQRKGTCQEVIHQIS